MKLVKFGKRYINMDHVTEIVFVPANSPGSYRGEPNGYRLHLNYVVDGSQSWMWVEGADAIALEYWLDDNSDDARAPMMTEETEETA